MVATHEVPGQALGRIITSVMNMAGHSRPSTLLTVDLDTFETAWIPIGADGPYASGLGITIEGDRLFHTWVADDGPFSSWLTILDAETLAVRSVQALPEVTDGHSMLRVDDELLIASTGTDEIISYRLDGDRVTRPRTVWSPTGSGADTHHVNSLLLHEGDLICTAFGPRDGVQYSWATARDGYVHNVSKDTRLVEGLHQPHSLAWDDASPLFCESPTGSISRPDGPVAWLAGYSRGLTFAPDGSLYAGTSLGRRRSRKRATARGAHDAPFHNLHDRDRTQASGRCSLIRFEPDGTRFELGLAHLAEELYDLVLLP